MPIVMLGTAPRMRSGIASIVETYASHGLFQRWDAVYLPTHRDGSKAGKLAIALGAWLQLSAQLLTGRVALLHIHVASYASFWRKTLFMLPARLVRVPYVLHLHGGAFVEFHRRQTPLAQRFIRARLRGAARVVALSGEWRDAIAAIEPEARIEVIPNPVDVPPWHAPLELPPPTVLFLGLLLERKGVHDLLEAWKTVVRAIPDAQLVLAGEGDEPALRERARECGVADSVRIVGWVEGEARDRLLRRAWVLTLPSHVEALPMVVLEALAAGLPVVATRVGGIPSVVEHERHGLLVPPRDPAALARALVSILGNGPRRKAMGRAARERAVGAFSTEVVIPRVEALWREIAPRQELRAGVRAA